MTLTTNSSLEVSQLHALKKAGHRYVLDFDHTLLLSNSTELFLSCASPSTIIAFALKVLGALKPWNLLGKKESATRVWRDVIRVIVVLLIAPWTVISFKRKASQLFEQDLNQTLDEQLHSVSPANIIIVSFGFNFILKALMRDSKYKDCTLIAPSIRTMVRYRKLGKLAMIKEHGLSINAENDIVITDSNTDDADLLNAVDNGLHIVWLTQINNSAFEGIYLPFYYLSKIKRSPEFFIKQVLLEEFPVILLSFGILNAVLSWHILLSLCFLFVAYLIVYEIGYAENDKIGFETEHAPKLTEAFFKYKDYKIEPYAWLAAIILTLLGVLVLDEHTTLVAIARLKIAVILPITSIFTAKLYLAVIWMALAALGRGMFWCFNHLSIKWRIYAYLPLHICKYFSPAVLFICHPVAYALISAHIVRTWALYAIRRAEGDIELISSQFVRFIFLLMFIPSLGLTLGQAAVWGCWQTWLIIGWCALRAIPEMRRKLFE